MLGGGRGGTPVWSIAETVRDAAVPNSVVTVLVPAGVISDHERAAARTRPSGRRAQ